MYLLPILCLPTLKNKNPPFSEAPFASAIRRTQICWESRWKMGLQLRQTDKQNGMRIHNYKRALEALCTNSMASLPLWIIVMNVTHT